MYNSFKEWKGLSEEEDSYHVLWVCTGVSNVNVPLHVSPLI